MATYYPSSNNQREAAPLLYLRDSLPNPFTETAPDLPSNMMMHMNCPSSSSSFAMAENEFLFMQPPMGPPSSILNGQGLSLSLGSEIPLGIQIPSSQFRSSSLGFSSLMSPQGSRNGSFRDDSGSLNKQTVNAEYFLSGFSGENQDLTKVDPCVSAVPNSKYLKAVKQLLNEAVNVGEALKPADSKKKTSKGGEGLLNPQECPGNSLIEPSPAGRQDLQSKLTKLLSMLDEVDRRYGQYHHQLQIVASSFDVISGYGSAKQYTSLALQTISCQFRRLRDAVTGQIQATRRILGDEHIPMDSKVVGIRRLRHVDRQLRQQRALQQLGMAQHTWRPQRGLPETSVSILRAWLFEHFLHPYPKDSDKIMLARQTGLSRNQVSNWFINARVRLWKPMVEDMYKEEIGDTEMESHSSSENGSKATKASEDRRQDLQPSIASTATNCLGGQFPSEMSGPITVTNFQFGAQNEPETGEQVPNVEDDSGLFPQAMVQAGSAYQMVGPGGLGNGGGVSLTLGLQHCDRASLPAHHIYDATAQPGTDGFHCMDHANQQQQQPRFRPPHVLHDFVP